MRWYQHVRDARFGEYEKYPNQCSYPLAVKLACYVETGTAKGAVQPTWDASLKIDFDHGNPIRKRLLVHAAKEIVCSGYKISRLFVGKTRKGHHVRIWLDPYIGGSTNKGQYTVLRFQRLLGDDPIRQRFNRGRVRRKRKGWNILFTAKVHNGMVTSAEEYDPEMTTRVAKALATAMQETRSR
jgi:hypothetical protein